jgi:hypothetical protein
MAVRLALTPNACGAPPPPPPPPTVATMAQTEHLPIYKKSYDLCLHLEQVVRGFSRYHKYTLGADLREGARRVLKLIVRAKARRDKVPLLLDVREEVEQLKVVLRLSQDVKAFANFGAFEQAIGQ